MNSFAFKRQGALCLIGMAAGAFWFTPNTLAACSYQIADNWGSGFTATVRITNTTPSAIDGWQVSWSYQNNVVTNAWNAQLTGRYSASNLSWNRIIAPDRKSTRLKSS